MLSIVYHICKRILLEGNPSNLLQLMFSSCIVLCFVFVPNFKTNSFFFLVLALYFNSLVLFYMLCTDTDIFNSCIGCCSGFDSRSYRLGFRSICTVWSVLLLYSSYECSNVYCCNQGLQNFTTLHK